MDPTVVAAWIAAGVSALTLVGTLAAQYFGRRATNRDIEKTLAEQSRQLDRTLGEQRTRTLNERFATAAGQLGDDKPPAVRLAGVYAMAGLADDWEASRQTCVDVLCAYLRMPYAPDRGQEASEPQRLAFQASREVRHTVIRIITARLRQDALVSWQGLNFDFTGVAFDGGDFSGAQFPAGKVDFRGAQFTDGEVDFRSARFSGAAADFTRVQFSGPAVLFIGAQFSGGTVIFNYAEFSGREVTFNGAQFSGGEVFFNEARFSGGKVVFSVADFSGGTVEIIGARFCGGEVDFRFARFSGAAVDFRGADFSGGEVDFSLADDWSFPPEFSWTDSPPSVVKLPSPGAA
jgi:uncharacterized protein YjbI with pentapeptide repeats